MPEELWCYSFENVAFELFSDGSMIVIFFNQWLFCDYVNIPLLTFSLLEAYLFHFSQMYMYNHRRQSQWGWGGVSMKCYYILQCTGIWDKNTFQGDDFFKNRKILCVSNKNSGDYTFNPVLRVELVGPLIPQFSTHTRDSPVFRPGWRLCV